MDGEDYFGDITVPLDEEEEDAANDLTFGDISDIKAGDDSDSAWKPNHLSLSSKIEAEKEALQRNRTLSDSAGTNGNDPTHVVLDQFHESSHLRAPAQATEGSDASPWDLLQHSLLQSQVKPSQTSPQHPLPQTLQGLDQSRLPQHIPQPAHPQNQPSLQHSVQQPLPYHFQPSIQQPLQQPGQHVHPHLPFHSPFDQPASQPRHEHLQAQLSPQELHQLLISYQQQQTNLLLRQHQETAEKQLREAERAQQAGVSFDRVKFDRHQEATRQMILSDHYVRLRQVQLQLYQYQQLQQVTERKLENASSDLLSSLNGAEPPRVEPHESLGQRLPTTRANIEESLNGFHYHGDGRNIANESHRNRGANLSFLDNTNIRNMRDEDIENAPRMLEIEREMAKAGLGPRSGKPELRKSAFDMAVGNRSVDAKGTEKKTKRRLESMTDRDQELVFRAHLRQIETSEVYKDDYYNAILKMKEKVGEYDVFSGLAERVQNLRLRGKEKVASRPVRSKGQKRPTQSSSAEERPAASSPPHSDQNMRALANALGTVQSWNPKAPRRVMDFSILEKRINSEDGAQQKSLRDDERVHVRQEVERGYDAIATVHDIVRGENQRQPLGQAIQTLMSTLHLAENRVDDLEAHNHKQHSTRFFATMCVIPKGRRYLALILGLLDVSERMRVMCAIFENLGMVVFASTKAKETSTGDKPVHPDLYSVMTKIVGNPDIDSQDCLQILESFIVSHVSHRDAFLTTFRSAVGSKLIFLCMQRICAGLSKNALSEEGLSAAKIDHFAEVFTQRLRDIFEGAESVKRVWEVSASLDALTTQTSRAKYRTELNRMLRAGLIPPPPAG